MKIDAQGPSSFSQTLRQLNESRKDRLKQMAARQEVEMRSALETVRNMPSAAETRKAAARERMAQLKSQLEALLKYPVGSVSPRFIAQLAKELKSLVAQYGGTGVSIPSESSATAASQPDADAAQDASAADGAAAEDAAAPTEAEIQGALAAASAATAATTDSKAAADGKAEARDSPAMPERAHARAAGNAADKEFFEEAKKLAKIIKALLTKSKEADAEDVKKAKKAIEDMDETIRKVESNVMDGEPSRLEISYDPGGASVSEGAGAVATVISAYA